MGDPILRCPLCCDKTFDSKAELIEHLAIVLENITCSICHIKWSSLEHFVEHLTLDNCQVENTAPTINLDTNSDPVTGEVIDEHDIGKHTLENAQIIRINNDTQKDLSDSFVSTINYSIDDDNDADDGSDMGKMYVEFLNKHHTKPCLQTQELKLVKDVGGVSRYVFLMNDDSNANTDMNMDAVVTKQNNDGTISLTTIRDMKTEAQEPMISREHLEADEVQEEIYSCNTCGVSFTSVLDHIQSYHNDQDVVVEELMDDIETESGNSIVPEFAEHAESKMEDLPADKQVSRRMITETGDIIETPLVPSTFSLDRNSYLGGEKSQLKPDFANKDGQSLSQQYIVIDSIVKEIKLPVDKPGPYHKVVIKLMEKENGEKVKVFNCMSCNIYVSSLEDFKEHPCKLLKYSCPHCTVTYDNPKSLCAHMKVHKAKPKSGSTVSGPTIYKCEICKTIFTTNKSLKLHKRMHDPIKSRPIEPPVESADGLEVSKDKFLCSVCNKLIPIDYRAVHQRSHRGKPELNCDICNKAFRSAQYLQMHMNVHLSDKMPPGRQDSSLPYICMYCDRRFSRPHEKVKHERIHTGERPHSCEICGKSFRVSYCLTLHMRTHTGARPYACAHCGKRFKAHSVYNHHLLTHSEVRAYKCPFCPKAFKTSVQLAGHKKSHTKPFSCQQCNRPFASLYAVRVHTETHARQNSLKFSCTLCGASYARAFALKDHIKAVHTKTEDKVEIDKALESMLVHEKDPEPLTTTIVTKDIVSWEAKKEDDIASSATTEITIDSKTHEVKVNQGTIIISNYAIPTN